MSIKFNKIIYPVFALILFVTGCEDGYDCNIENVAYNRVGFYCVDDNKKENKYEFPDTLTVSLMVNGKDSIVVNKILNATDLQLPMSYNNERDTLIFHYTGKFTDTLYIDHENIPFYISMECGTVMYHKLTGIKYTNSFIDSAVIANDYIKFENNENIKIYFID